MKRYYYIVTVEQTFLDTMNLCVEAEDAGEAHRIIKQSMDEFPGPLTHDRIKHLYIENREKLNSHLVTVERQIPVEPVKQND